jgi:DNA-binding MarR family transcriptional regulator
MVVSRHSDKPTLGKRGTPLTAKEISIFFELVRSNRELMGFELAGVNSAGTGPIIYFMIMHACIDAKGEPADVSSIAVHVGCARTTAQRHLKELKKIGWIADHQDGKRVCWSATELGGKAYYRTITAVIENARLVYSQLLQVGGELDDANLTKRDHRG